MCTSVETENMSVWINVAHTIIHSHCPSSFQSHFGLSPQLCQLLWTKMSATHLPPNLSVIHLLWVLYFLKTTPSSVFVLTAHLQIDKNTFFKWLPTVLDTISQALPKVSKFFVLNQEITFDERWVNWDALSPSHVVDVTFIPITQPYLCSWEYWNSEYHKFGFKYQITCSLGGPKICSVHGPFKGSAADVSIYRQTIVPMLKVGEKGLGDSGYRHESNDHVIAAGSLDGIMVSKAYRVRQNIERLIERMKNWGCLTVTWKYSWRLHKRCIEVIAQLANFILEFQPLDSQ